jgi:hypothetical protein
MTHASTAVAVFEGGCCAGSNTDLRCPESCPGRELHAQGAGGLCSLRSIRLQSSTRTSQHSTARLGAGVMVLELLLPLEQRTSRLARHRMDARSKARHCAGVALHRDGSASTCGRGEGGDSVRGPKLLGHARP